MTERRAPMLHTIKALVLFDKTAAKRKACWDRASTDAGVALAQAYDRKALFHVQLAFFRDTYKVNLLDRCMQADIGFMRRCAHPIKDSP